MTSPEELINEPGSERLLQLLRSVDRSRPTPAGSHFVDDDEVLDRWSAGELTKDEHRNLLQHLAACSECSDILQEMILAEAFEFPKPLSVDQSVHEETSAEQVSVSVTTSSHPDSEPQRAPRRWAGFAVSTAACCLALIGYLVFRGSGDDMTDVTLAQADYGQLTHYLTNPEFGSMVTGGHSKGGGGTLFVPPDEDRDKRIEAMSQTVASAPENLTARLNLAQLLLEAGELEDAVSEFEFVLQKRPRHPAAKLGRAMVWYRQKKAIEAEAEFAELGTNSVAGVSARINQVVCLIAMERKAEARAIWDTIPATARPEKLERVLAVEE